MEAAGLANEIRAAAHAKMEAKFESEARAFLALTSGSASASGAEGPGQEPVIDLSAPVEATPDTKRKVSAFCHNPVAERMGITYHGFENPLAEATAARTDAALDCLGALADWIGTIDDPSKFVTAMPSAVISCTTGLRYTVRARCFQSTISLRRLASQRTPRLRGCARYLTRANHCFFCTALVTARPRS
jgi:hypothetical protein